MIRADSHYVIGQSHLYVQDYALSSADILPLILVADGCSSAAHADIGARLIALAARQYLIEQISVMDAVPDAMLFASNIAWRAHAAASMLGIAHSGIDATLLLAFVKNNVVHVYVLGDGVVAIKKNEVPLQIISVNYPHSAPFYPAYLTDQRRREAYEIFSQGQTRLIEGDDTASSDLSITQYSYFKWPVETLQSIYLASDGVQSFVNMNSAEALPVDEVMAELTAFKNINDAFIKRRMKRALKDWGRDNITHSDDVALAALVFEAGGAS